MEQTVFDKILSTGEADLLIGKSTREDQMVRLAGLMEVAGELSAAVQYEDKGRAADAIGYCIVTLTMLAAQLKLDVVRCIPEPYNGIKAENIGDGNRMLAKRFKKLSAAEVEAVQWTGDNLDDVIDWLMSNNASFDSIDFLEISTLEGLIRPSKNDWIIRGVIGGLDLCKPDIFEKTYVAVD